MSLQHLTSPISQLPDRVLSIIFDRASKQDEPNSTADAQNNPVLLVLAQVCKRWRGIALGSWERVEVFNHVEWLDLVLSHSQAPLLDVRFHRVRAAEDALAQSLLKEHACRVRGLSLCWRKVDADLENPTCGWKRVNNKVCQMSLPVLKSLRIDNADIDRAARASPVLASPCRLHILHTLRLTNIIVPWQSTVFERLRVLHLEKIKTKPLLSLDEFLAVLQRCTLLEELTLAHAFPVNFPDRRDAKPVRAAGSLRIVVLPRLRTVNFVWGRKEGPWRDRMEILWMMGHMYLSARVSVTIDIEHWGFPGDRLRHVVHPRKDLLPILSTATTIYATSFPGKQGVFETKNDEGGSLTVVVTNRREDGRWAYRIEDQLRNFCEILLQHSAPVRKISIESWEVDKATVTRGFGSTLTAIEILYAHPALLDDLLAQLVSRARDNAGPVNAPNLRRLHLGSLTWHPALLDRIYNCLEWRLQHKTELTELYIEIDGRDVDLDDEIARSAEIMTFQMQMSPPAKVTIKNIPLPKRFFPRQCS